MSDHVSAMIKKRDGEFILYIQAPSGKTAILQIPVILESSKECLSECSSVSLHSQPGVPPVASGSVNGFMAKTLFRAIYDGSATSEGALIIYKEREDQLRIGHTPEDDHRENTTGQLLKAAIAYICLCLPHLSDKAVFWWPWLVKSYNPQDTISNLARAGAFIAAEIDRIQYKEVK